MLCCIAYVIYGIYVLCYIMLYVLLYYVIVCYTYTPFLCLLSYPNDSQRSVWGLPTPEVILEQTPKAMVQSWLSTTNSGVAKRFRRRVLKDALSPQSLEARQSFLRQSAKQMQVRYSILWITYFVLFALIRNQNAIISIVIIALLWEY
jgi:hypothetical protein